MLRYRPSRSLLCAALLFALAAGCQALPWYRPVVIQVRDADTKKPIPQATATLSYPNAQAPWPSWDSHGATAADGIVRLRAAPQADAAFLVDLKVEGYFAEAKVVPAKTVQAIEPAHFLEAVERRPVNMVLEMVAEQPIPTIELVVPNAYRGLVKVELRTEEDAPCPLGQRTFRCTVPLSGSAELSVPPLLQRFAYPHFRAAYADGTPLKDTAKDAEVGFWLVKVEGRTYSFLVGTQAEHARYLPQPQDDSGEKKPSGGGGKGRGRGRGNRRGDQSASDSSSQ